MEKENSVSTMYAWLERVPESLVAQEIRRVNWEVYGITEEKETPATLQREDKGMMNFYNSLVRAFNERLPEIEEYLRDLQTQEDEQIREDEQISENEQNPEKLKELTLEDFLFDSEMSQCVLGEL
jgi:hypothetical protein